MISGSNIIWTERYSDGVPGQNLILPVALIEKDRSAVGTVDISLVQIGAGLYYRSPKSSQRASFLLKDYGYMPLDSACITSRPVFDGASVLLPRYREGLYIRVPTCESVYVSEAFPQDLGTGNIRLSTLDKALGSTLLRSCICCILSRSRYLCF